MIKKKLENYLRCASPLYNPVIFIYAILPKVLAPPLMKGLTALVISMSMNLNV